MCRQIFLFLFLPRSISGSYSDLILFESERLSKFTNENAFCMSQPIYRNHIKLLLMNKKAIT